MKELNYCNKIRYELQFKGKTFTGEVEAIDYVEGTPVPSKWKIKLNAVNVFMLFDYVKDRILIFAVQGEEVTILAEKYKSLKESIDALPNLLKEYERKVQV